MDGEGLNEAIGAVNGRRERRRARQRETCASGWVLGGGIQLYRFRKTRILRLSLVAGAGRSSGQQSCGLDFRLETSEFSGRKRFTQATGGSTIGRIVATRFDAD
jgi:hypothetical protein